MVEQGLEQLVAEAAAEQLVEQAGEPGPGRRADGVLRGGDPPLVAAYQCQWCLRVIVDRLSVGPTRCGPLRRLCDASPPLALAADRRDLWTGRCGHRACARMCDPSVHVSRAGRTSPSPSSARTTHAVTESSVVSSPATVGTMPISRNAGQQAQPQRHGRLHPDRAGPVLDRGQGGALELVGQSLDRVGHRAAAASRPARACGRGRPARRRRPARPRPAPGRRPSAAEPARRPGAGPSAPGRPRTTAASAACGDAPERRAHENRSTKCGSSRAAASRSRRTALGSDRASATHAAAAATGAATRPSGPPRKIPAPRPASRQSTGRHRPGRVATGAPTAGRAVSRREPRTRWHEERRRERGQRRAASTVIPGPPGRRWPRSTTARRPRRRARRPRQPQPTGVSSRKRHGLPPAPEPIPSATTGRTATSRAVARAEASSEVTTRWVWRCARIRDATRETACARPVPEWWATCQAAATTRRSPAPGACGHPTQRARDVRAQRPGVDHRREAGPATRGLGQRVARADGRRRARRPAPRRRRARRSRSSARTTAIAAASPDQPATGSGEPDRHDDDDGARRQPAADHAPTADPGAPRSAPAATSTPRPTGRGRRHQQPGREPGQARRPAAPSADPLRQQGRARARASSGRRARTRRRRRSTPCPTSHRTGTPTWVTRRRPSGARATWTTASRAEASWLCAASRGSPAAAASASIRAGTSPAELACSVPQPPACPVLSAASRSTTSAPRTSPTTSRSGRIRRA